MSRAVVCDVNETMLDLSALDPLFASWFGDAAVRKEWFAQTLHCALTLAATRAFKSFAEVGAGALNTIANRHGVSLPADALPQLRATMEHLPAHPDVEPGLRLLHEAGFKLAALSNNPLPVVRQQMRHAGLAELFDEIMSVDEAGALKPAPEVYALAVTRLGLPPDAIWMVAAHGFDIAGATRTGMRGAFVARPGQLQDPFAPAEIAGNDLIVIANAIIAAEGVR
jgi:2-haloacid dehalogenase